MEFYNSAYKMWLILNMAAAWCLKYKEIIRLIWNLFEFIFFQ